MVNIIVPADHFMVFDTSNLFRDRFRVILQIKTIKYWLLANILNRAINNTLVVKPKWTEIYGISVQGILNFRKEIWWVQIIWTIVSMFLGALIGELVGGWFK